MYNFMMKESGFDLFALCSPCLRFSGANGLLLQEAMRIMLPMVRPIFLSLKLVPNCYNSPHTLQARRKILC